MKIEIQPVVIIGAGRSGTNMFRDLLIRFDDLGTWPCDEINYIWRYGNARYPTDALPPDLVRPSVVRYIQSQFEWVANKYKVPNVVEKTCANSLRVDFVDKTLPNARYLFIRRNGLDAAASAMKRWKATLDPMYLLRKARFVPPSDLPYYAGRYLGNRVHRLLSRERRLSTWGPKFEGIEHLLTELTLEEVCGIQWKRCVDSASDSLARIPESRWLEIGYEDFVSEPEKGLSRILDFLKIPAKTQSIRQAVSPVTARNIGKGRKDFSEKTIERVIPHIHDTMEKYGYA